MMSASEPAAAAAAPAPVAPPAQPQRAPLDSTWPWGLVCLASLIEFAAAADAENTNSPCDQAVPGAVSQGKCNWAIAVGVIAFVFALVMMFLVIFFKRSSMAIVECAMAGFFCIWWAVGTAVNVSAEGPFPDPGNVYYASWVALFTSSYLLYVSVVNVTRPAEDDVGVQAESKGDQPARSRGHRHRNKKDEGTEMTATGPEPPKSPEPLAPEAEYADAAAAE